MIYCLKCGKRIKTSSSVYIACLDCGALYRVKDNHITVLSYQSPLTNKPMTTNSDSN